MNNTAPAASVAPAASSVDASKKLDGSEISKDLSPGPQTPYSQPVVGIDYNIFQGSADGATGNSGGGVGGTGGVGGAAGDGVGGAGGGYAGGPVRNRYAGGGTVAPIAGVADIGMSPEEKKKKEEQDGSQNNYYQAPVSGDSKDYIGQWAYDLSKGNIEGMLKGPALRALEKGDILRALSPANLIIGGLAHGGPVNQDHNNRLMANHLARQGRGRDTTLVHMSRPEVMGLGSLHPSGRMPVNPKTGLPEADFLTDVLPGLAGTVVGSMVGMPWLGAVVGGLGTWATTGNLGKGIMSGLMSYGLGSIAGQLGDAGAKAAGEVASSGANDVVSKAAASAAQTPGGAAAGINPATFSDPMAQGAAQVSNVASSAPPPQGMLAKISQGLNNPGQAFSNIGNGIMNPQNLDLGKMVMPGIMAASGMGGLSAANQQPAQIPNPMAQQGGKSYNGTPSSVPYRTYTGGVAPSGYGGPGYQGELSYFAPNPAYQTYAATGGQVRAYATGGGVMPEGQPYTELAAGGVTSLPSGMIRGDGAGMDDKIKGTIDGRRDVYLSDGEYVVDAHTISALGDGSSEAGAKRMKEIVEEIRQKKFGNKKQPKRMASYGGLASLRMAGGSDGNVDYGPEYLPASAEDFTEASMRDGKIEYKKRGPGFGKKELAKAREELKYMEDLTRRNAPLVLNEKYVGRGVPDNTSPGLYPRDLVREISRLTIGQPYGRFSPPYESEVNEKRRMVEDAMINAREPGHEDIIRKRYQSAR